MQCTIYHTFTVSATYSANDITIPPLYKFNDLFLFPFFYILNLQDTYS